MILIMIMKMLKIISSHISKKIQKTVRPYLEKLKQQQLSATQKRYVDVIEAGIHDIGAPYIRSLAATIRGLTSVETRVAHLIRIGNTTKEIADILGLSVNTIMTHRYNIRTKLGLKNSKQNLYTYLNALQEK